MLGNAAAAPATCFAGSILGGWGALRRGRMVFIWEIIMPNEWHFYGHRTVCNRPTATVMQLLFLFVCNDAVEHSAAASATPAAAIGPLIEHDAGGIGAAAGNRQLVHDQDGGVAGKLHLDRDGHDKLLIAI